MESLCCDHEGWLNVLREMICPLLLVLPKVVHLCGLHYILSFLSVIVLDFYLFIYNSFCLYLIPDPEVKYGGAGSSKETELATL